MHWLCIVLLVAVAVAARFDLSDSAVQAEWSVFRAKFAKNYASPSEGSRRFEIFRRNLAAVNIISEYDAGAQYGVTQFMDLSPEEFESRYLSPMPKAASPAERMTPVHLKDVPDSWDWREHGAVTPVKNQGGCGSCWAFSTIFNVESQWFLAGNKLTQFSEQQLVDCDRDKDEGCNGGYPEWAFDYIMKTGGIDTEDSYPYVGFDNKCQFKPASIGAKIKNWTFISEDESVIRDTLYSKGPLSVALNAGWLQFYLGGISEPVVCNPKNLDHAVGLTGYGRGKNILGVMTDYWLVKNSWGSGWGEKGYFRMKRGKGTCGINTHVTTAIV